MKAKKRLLSLLLCGTMMFSLCPQAAFAERIESSGKTIGGLCEHHPAHDESCGYAEGIPGTPCNHEHDEDCYKLETECVHEHDEDCYPAEDVSDNTATSSDADEAEPTECDHECSEESGCITKELDCQHEHDEDCDYFPAEPGTPCGYVCEICDAEGGGETVPADPEEKPEAECTCETLCTAEEANADCPVCGAEGADLTLCKGAEPETATPSEAEKSPVGEVQRLIDELPTADELAAMSPEEQQAVYTKLQAAYEAYNALTDEQKAEVTGAEVFDSLFDVFNGMVNALANQTDYNINESVVTIDDSCGENCPGHTITGSSTSNTITVSGGAHTIILSGVSIDIPSVNQDCPIDLQNAGATTVTLAEGTTNTLKAGNDRPGIYVPANNKVTFNGTGSLNVTGGAAWPGIGRNDNGNIQIDNGIITAVGGEYAAGIGGSGGHSGGTITITGGTVKATSGENSAGIGGGLSGNGGIITITGGKITAVGNGSTDGGAGIGGGGEGNAGTITIKGGTIEAFSSTSGSGIGGGHDGRGGKITINGGTVTARGNINGAGIGGGHNGYVDTITINGGIVTATGGSNSDFHGSAIGNGGPNKTQTSFQCSGNAVIIADSASDVAAITDTSSSAKWKGVIFQRTSGKVYAPDDNKTITITDSFTIPEGCTLEIPEGVTLVIPDGVTLTNNGTINGDGAINGDGKINGNQPTGNVSVNLRSDAKVSVSFGGVTGNSVYYGSTISITANIAKVTDQNTLAAAKDQVEFFVGTGGDKKSLGTANVSGTAATLSNVAVSNENGFTVGENTITAEYGGSMGLKPKIGTATLTVNPIPLSKPGNLTLTSSTHGGAKAEWGAVTNASGYSVQLYKDGTAQGEPVSVNNDTEYTFENITEAGSYTFKVKATGTGDYADSEEAESSSLTFYEVAFDLNDGSGSIEPQIVASGGKATEPAAAPTKTGYTFKGWYKDDITNWIFDTDTVSQNTTIYAKWTAIIYKVTVTVEGGTDNTASASPASATIETQVTLTATPAEGYHFVEWEVVSDGVTITDNKFTMPAGNVEVKAVFAEHQYSNWQANGDDTHTGTCSCGETKTEACSYTDGTCTVCGYVDVAITDGPNDITVKEDETAAFAVTAKGEDISYQWQIKAGNNDWADISGAQTSGYTTEATTMEMNGYQYRCTVSNGKGDSATSNAAALTVQKAASEMEPEFIGYFAEHYKKNPVSGEYEQADREYHVDKINETVTATPKNYTGYTYNPNAAGTITSGTLNEITDEKDIVTLKLYYDPNTYVVKLDAGNGTIAAGKDVTEYTYGVGAALPTADDMTYTGHAFKGWYENSSFSGEPVTKISDTATGNKTYYAKWAKLWTVAVHAEDGGAVSGGGTFEENAEVTVTATPNSGYHFVRWTENGTEVSTSASYSFALTADRNLTAVFSRNSSGGGGGGTSYDYFTITANAGAGGSISPSGRISVRERLDKTFTITPAGDYRISDVLVDGKSVGAVNSYTFENVRAGHTIEAVFAKENPGTGVDNPFTDVKESDWFYNDVMFVYGNGLMSGTSGTTFEPNANTTRAQIAAIFYRLDGSPKVEGKNSFTDVPYGPGTAWYYDVVTWAQQKGIIGGYGNNLFGPNAPVTREQLAVIFYNYAKYKGYALSSTSDLSGFTDAGEVSAWAQDAMKWAVGSGLMSGKGNNILDPKGTATRAEIAAMLHNFIERNHLVPPAALPGGNGGTGGTGGGGGWTQQLPSPQTGDGSHIGL